MSEADPRCTILLIDDEEANLDLLEDFLDRAGFDSLVRCSDARAAVELFERVRPDLVLLDLHMPHVSGHDVLAQIRSRTPPDDFRPILVLTADVTFHAKQQALSGGANDFVGKPFHNEEVLLRVRNLLRTRHLYESQRRAREHAELLAEVGRILSASLDGGTALEQLAHLLVPRFGDECLFEQAGVVDEGEGSQRDLQGTIGPAAGDLVGLDPGFRSVASAPIGSSDGGSGRLIVVRDPNRPGFAPDEVAVVEEIARRIGLSLEAARLLSTTRDAVELRERVLAVVAHDLRNPLTAIRMDAEMLVETLPDSDSPSTRTARRIRRAADRMDGLIADLLEVTRLEHGTPSLQPTAIDLRALVEEAAEAIRPLAAAHALRVDVAESGNAILAWADPARILQAIGNLVGNAVKFSPAGGSVRIGVVEQAAAARISVTDTGNGIPAEQIPHIFGAFWQAAHADRRGLGLGLAIARGIVEEHGGRIWVESEVGAGTTFHFTLPLVSAGSSFIPASTDA